jgi:hypothetical protein
MTFPIRELANKILALFEAQLEHQGVKLPDRRYVSPGVLPAWDGDQLVVNLQNAGQGRPGAPFVGAYLSGAEILQAQYAISLVRVVPALSGEGQLGSMIPGADALTEAGEETMTDADALMQAAISIHAANTLVEAGKGFAIDGVTTMGPDGGLAANRLLLTISL